jgi:carbonic anhydrase
VAPQLSTTETLSRDVSAGLVVFLVALPLCLGVALASGAPLVSGLVAGVVGGLLVSWLSGSHTSISGPAAGLTAIVATQIDKLGSFDAFLVAVVMAGALQVALGLVKAGSVAAFFPSSVIKGLLAAIGIILILKQIPHLLGHDPDWLGDMSFFQLDGRNTFSELLATVSDVHLGAATIGVGSVLALVLWDRSRLKESAVPGALVVVVGGILLTVAFDVLGGAWQVSATHRVQVPVVSSVASLSAALHRPDFSTFGNSAVLLAAVTVAIVATLESLLNLEAVDKIDPRKRTSPPNRELIAQGIGNMTSGILGGLPVTSVVVRSSVGVTAGGQTRLTSFVHGVLLLGMVLVLPELLNRIPLSCLAAVLLVTGFKLAKPSLFRQMWEEGPNQFIPFAVTVGAIVLTDLLIGIVVGMIFALLFILRNNYERPLRRITERHVGGDVLRIKFASQLSFLNRASLSTALDEIPHGSQVVLDARATDYMDADIIALIREFETEIAPARRVQVSLLGLREHYDPADSVSSVNLATLEVQERATPEQILEMLRAGNQRFLDGERILRDSRSEVGVTAAAEFPLAVVLACMDSRIATERLFDLGLGEIFSVRVAGNVASEEGLGSMEYGCAVAGSKLLVVLGHTRCGAVDSTVHLVAEGNGQLATTGHGNLDSITKPIAEAMRKDTETPVPDRIESNDAFMLRVTTLNVRHSMAQIRKRSATLRQLIDDGKVLLVGGIYDVATGRVEFLE